MTGQECVAEIPIYGNGDCNGWDQVTSQECVPSGCNVTSQTGEVCVQTQQQLIGQDCNPTGCYVDGACTEWEQIVDQTCIEYETYSEDDCVGEYDECGICNGPGAVFECGCADIPTGDCDCAGNTLDECGVCGGDNSSCEDCAGVPNGTSWESDCGCVAVSYTHLTLPTTPYV